MKNEMMENGRVLKVDRSMEHLCDTMIAKGTCGYVYIFSDKQRNKHKIGFTTKLDNRIRNIATSGGIIDYDYYATGLILNPRELERELHTIYAPYRTVGEWFTIDGAEAISRLTSIMRDTPYAHNDELVELRVMHAKREEDFLTLMKGVLLGGKPIYTDSEGIVLLSEWEKVVSTPATTITLDTIAEALIAAEKLAKFFTLSDNHAKLKAILIVKKVFGIDCLEIGDFAESVPVV